MTDLSNYDRKGIEVTFINKEQTFTITVKGLLPLTYHYVYVEDTKTQAANIRPFGKDYGDDLISDANGDLIFDFLYNTGLGTSTSISDAEQAAALYARPGGLSVIVTNISDETLPTNYAEASLSYFPISIQTSVFIPQDEADWQIVKQ